MKRPYTEYTGSRVIKVRISHQQGKSNSTVLSVFKSTIQCELYVAKMLDNGLAVDGELKAKAFKQDFQAQNSKITQSLKLNSMRLGPSSMIALANITRRNRICRISLADNDFGDAGMSSIKNLLSNSDLTHLNLASNKITKVGFHLIFQILMKNTTLLHLDLGIYRMSLHRNLLGLQGAKCIALILMKNITLQSLVLRDNEILKEGARLIGQSLAQNRTLKKLTLCNNGVDKTAACLILKFGQSLIHLDLSDNSLGPSIGTNIKQFFKFSVSIRSLFLSNTSLGQGVIQIARGLAASKLQRLSLSKNCIGDDRAPCLAEALKGNQSLTYLDVGMNGLTGHGIAAICHCLGTCSITDLVLSGNVAGEGGLDYLLHEKNMLRSLQARNCELDQQTVLSFLMRSGSHPSLKRLDLRDNFISGKVQKQLVEVIRKNRWLETIQLGSNRVSMACIRQIQLKLASNRQAINQSQINQLSNQLKLARRGSKKTIVIQQGLQAQKKILYGKKARLQMEMKNLELSKHRQAQQKASLSREKEKAERARNMMDHKLTLIGDLRTSKLQQLQALQKQFQQSVFQQ